ncbi:MAG TPA: lipid-A-disaccharide synthase [Desulfobacteraceae bacterium]|nr:lipid-A-disaccharide synthase [Desulfobacteraceae bacterium]|tara:strand:- start:886 stop:2046 length:1161 start_codon:yes stop_codon:yes gene_type:complete
MTAKAPHIMILTGEPSGDFHAGPVIQALKALSPDARISGIGGPVMTAQGADVFFPIERLSAMGLFQVIRQFSTIKSAFNLVKQRIQNQQPDLVVLIDYPGFNLRMAQYIKEHTRIPVCYYIAPKVWAWNAARLKKLKAYTDHVALILPFEQPIYKKKKISATYVGNPLLDEYAHTLIGGQSCDSDASGEPGPIIGLLPGSRASEIEKLLPVMLDSAAKIQSVHTHARFLISAASGLQAGQIQHILKTHDSIPRHCEVIQGRPITIFSQAQMLIAASGTVTLEAALCRLPTILVYRVSPLTFGLGKLLVKVNYVGLANLIAGMPVMPELLQSDANPEKISHTAFLMLNDLDRYRRQLEIVRRRLGTPGAPKRAAGIMLSLVTAKENH